MGTLVRTGSRVLVWVACLLLAFPATPPGSEITQPEVDTTLGQVRGRQVGVKGTDRLVNVFLGIPFAQPPLGPGRFSAPRPAQSWEGVRDASTAPPMCLQDLERMNNGRFVLNGKHQIFPISEDCLILNIYSPAEATAGAGKPVMVWIHGGALLLGAATSQDGSALAAYGDVVVVTVQYRLGLPGFFSTGDKHAAGNWGFLDVVAALHWVQGNITPFGGDPNSVTIFGGSAGACIVSALVLSPLAAGLFHRAIAQSGVITQPGLLDSDPWPLAQSFADFLACSSNSSAEMVQCLRQKASKELILPKTMRITAAYTIDGTFFPKTPKELLRERRFHSVPFLLGVNNHEFGWLIPRGWGILDKMEQMNVEDVLATLRPYLTKLDVPHEVMSTIMDEYQGSRSHAHAKREAFQELLSDIILNFPILNFSRNLRDSGVSVFFYEFQHRPSSFVKIKPAWVKADHGAETAFIFGGPFLTDESSTLAFPEATEEEKQLSLTMMAQWTHFARTGNPNGEGLPSWPPFNQSEQYLEISVVPRVSEKLREAQRRFWEEIYPTKIRQREQKQKGSKAQEEL
ncbi:carboxylesterase 3 isoform X1 [Equus caballus]|uniref:carboxylesterase 3 isoform X1 n=2 Tax=Equus caballus TaxID=9796 RepID=UPI0038B28BAA